MGKLRVILIGGASLTEGEFFTRDRTFVTYFDGPARGLKKGTPVEFEGVKVGGVAGVDLQYDPVTNAVRVPDALLRGKTASGKE